MLTYIIQILYRKICSGLQEVETKNVEANEEGYKIIIEQPRGYCSCPHCGK